MIAQIPSDCNILRQKASERRRFAQVNRLQLFELKRIGLIPNALYVLRALQLINPYGHKFRFNAQNFCRDYGDPFPGGVIPDRSLRAALRILTTNNLIEKSEDSWGVCYIKVNVEALFLCSGAANSCQEGGKPLPDESPKPLPEADSSDRKTDLYRSNYLNKDQQQIDDVVENFQFSGRKKTRKRKREINPTGMDSTKSLQHSRDPEEDTLSAAALKNLKIDRIQARLTAIGCELERAELERDEYSVLEKLLIKLEETENPRVTAAIATFKQAKAVESPGKFIMAAIRDGYKPRQSKDIPAAKQQDGLASLKTWMQAAEEANLAQYSRREDDQVLISKNANAWFPFPDLRDRLCTLDAIASLSQEERATIKYLNSLLRSEGKNAPAVHDHPLVTSGRVFVLSGEIVLADPNLS